MEMTSKKHSDDNGPTVLDIHAESWRANIPLLRTVATAMSIVLSVIWLSWQGSQWVSEMRSEMRELRQSIVAITKTLEEKAAGRDVEHRFQLMCAMAPPVHRGWVCGPNTKTAVR